MTRPTVFVEFSPSGGLFQFGAQLGQALAADGRQVELWTGPDPELSFHTDGFSIRSVLPTWHPADQEVRLACRSPDPAAAAGGATGAGLIVLGALLIRSRPRAVVFSHWRFAFEPAFVAVYARLLPRTAFALIAHEPFPRSDAKDTSTVKSGRVLQACFAAAWQQLDVVFVLGSRTKELVQDHWRPTALSWSSNTATRGAGPRTRRHHTRCGHRAGRPLLRHLDRVQGHRRTAGRVRTRPRRTSGCRTRHGRSGGRRRRPARGPRTSRVHRERDDDDRIHPHRPGRADRRIGPPAGHPYVRASQSGVVHLAYTFGRPVVATEVGDLAEAVHDGENGLLVPPQDPRRSRRPCSSC